MFSTDHFSVLEMHPRRKKVICEIELGRHSPPAASQLLLYFEGATFPDRVNAHATCRAGQPPSPVAKPVRRVRPSRDATLPRQLREGRAGR
jgi:hypothetical protein